MDLFVRVSNKVAITMYQQLGYIVYRTVLEYYNGDPDEDAYGRYILRNLKYWIFVYVKLIDILIVIL